MQKYFLILTAFFIAVLSLGTSAVAETCKAHELDGKWINVRAEKKVIHRIEIETSCAQNTDVLKLKIRALEKCHPRDCSWGWSELVDLGQGELVAVFKTFIAERRLEISPVGSRLRVGVVTNYISPERQDTSVSHVLVRQAN
ncbi:MAG: hypothetical protein ABJO30_06615 [Hyphomicrobiales bacterium]